MTDQTPAPGWDAGAPKSSRFNGRALLVIGAAVLLAYLFFNRQTPTRSPVINDNGDGGGVAPPTTVQITYELTGSATGADLTYTDGSGNIQQHANASVPLRTESGLTGIRFTVERGSFVSFSAQNTGESGDLTCTIKAGGVVLNTGRSSGGYTIVSCSATVP